jgi:hypothetical protein
MEGNIYNFNKDVNRNRISQEITFQKRTPAQNNNWAGKSTAFAVLGTPVIWRLVFASGQRWAGGSM